MRISDWSSDVCSSDVSGIINIITNKEVENGYTGSLNSSEKFPEGGWVTGGSIMLQQGKFGINTIGGINRSRSPQVSSINTRSSRGAYPTHLIQNGLLESTGKEGY